MIKELRILKKLEELTGEGSQKAKQELIKQNWNDDLAYIFDVCFNPFVTTKLRDKYVAVRLSLDDPSNHKVTTQLLSSSSHPSRR
jgi:hypothetical protein